MYEKYVLVEESANLSFSSLVMRIRELHPNRTPSALFAGAMRLKQGIENTFASDMPGY